MQALAALGHWEAAAARARRGEALAAGPHGRAPEFQALMDDVAVTAAAAGSDAGFDGRQLEARAPLFQSSFFKQHFLFHLSTHKRIDARRICDVWVSKVHQEDQQAFLCCQVTEQAE